MVSALNLKGTGGRILKIGAGHIRICAETIPPAVKIQ